MFLVKFNSFTQYYQCHLANVFANFKRLKTDTSGIAMVEFALGLPIMLLVTLFGLETVNFVLTHQQVSQTAMLVADNAARTRVQMDEQNIDEIFFGAQATGGNLEIGENSRIILSQISHNGLNGSDEGNWVRWQRCYGKLGAVDNLTSSYGLQGDGKTNSSLASGVGPAGNQISATQSSALNFVEIVHAYQPLIDNPFTAQLFEKDERIRYTAAFTVRERTMGDISNNTSIPGSLRWRCNRYRSF